MSNRGDDCYFFYYSTCTKGDSCPFRHCEAAMGNETVCSLWQEGRCFRNVCKFRHMEITHNRKEIPCYWETQATGCQKPHCAFFHEKPRYVDGMCVPPDKNPSKSVEQPQEEPPSLPAAANTQRREAIKTEGQVPSPTHPPVVINPADDEDEDEDEDGEVCPSPRKHTSGDSLHFGVSNLEEIRLRKALKASMRKAGYPMQPANSLTNKDTENIEAFFRADLYDKAGGTFFDVLEETEEPKVSVAERLGGKRLNTGMRHTQDVPQNRSLAVRLGNIVDKEALLTPSQNALRPVKERLGLSPRSGAAQSAETVTASKKAPGQIHIKTLEEIRQEKAAKSKDSLSVVTPDTGNTKPAKGINRAVSMKDQPISDIKMFSAKRSRQEAEQQSKPGRVKASGRSNQEESGGMGPASEALNLPGIQVKTLEEIRREKAARVQAQEVLEAEIKKKSDAEESCGKKTRLFQIQKMSPQTEKSTETTKTPVRTKTQTTAETSVTNDNGIKVKTFEEIMWEKRLRKQEVGVQAKGSPEVESSHKQSAKRTLKGKVPAHDTAQNAPARKLISLKSKAAALSLKKSEMKQGSSSLHTPCQNPSSSKENPDNSTRNSVSTASPVKAARTEACSRDPERMLITQQEHAADTKVRPKLNVKPSVVKPSVQLKAGQKRRGAEWSAVAAVKPLKSTSTVLEEPLQKEVLLSSSSEAQLTSAVPSSTVLETGSGSSPLREELQTVPVFRQIQQPPAAVSVPAATEACVVLQSPVLRSPTQSKLRRVSIAASRTASTSAMDDFEELISEFTDDHLAPGDVDPDIGEDDLLQELSEMIDS